MPIEKIVDFAENGDKSIKDLNLKTGFPRQQKPYRQWMNYLFNWLSSKTNEVIDEVNEINLRVEPLLQPIAVGEGFFTINDYQSPSEVAEIKGYGTWERFAEGRTLVGYSSSTLSSDDYRIMGNEFGENKHTLTIAETPKHDHRKDDHKTEDPLGDRLGPTMHYGEAGSGTYQGEFSSGYSGGGEAHNNIQPSIVVAYWLRVE